MSNGLNRIDELDEVQQLRAELASARETIADTESRIEFEIGQHNEAEIHSSDLFVENTSLREANASLRAENAELVRNAEALRAQLHTMSDNYAGAIVDNHKLDEMGQIQQAFYNAAMDRAEAAEARANEADRLYHELIMAVATKYEGETRHETALRYIVQAEARKGDGPAMAAPAPTAGTGNGD